MKILFLDTACAAFPSRVKGHEHWKPHCLRVAAILEDDGEEVGRVIALVRPKAGWMMEPATFPYHKAGPDEFEADGLPVVDAAKLMLPLLEQCDMIVAHHLSFHEKVLKALQIDGGLGVIVDTPMMTFDTMSETADIVQVKLQSQGRWKSPSLAEAYQFFARKPLEVVPQWDRHATKQVEAVRTIYHSATKRPAVSQPVYAGKEPF